MLNVRKHFRFLWRGLGDFVVFLFHSVSRLDEDRVTGLAIILPEKVSQLTFILRSTATPVLRSRAATEDGEDGRSP